MGFVAAAPALWASIASTAVSVVGAISQGEQASAQAKAKAKAEEYNAAIARNKAESSRAIASQKEDAQRRRARLIIGQQRASDAGSGFLATGSVADSEMQSMVNAELDAMNIRYQGDMEAKGYLSQAGMSEFNADNYGIAASNATNSGYLGAASSMLSGASKVYTKMSQPTTSNTPKVD